MFDFVQYLKKSEKNNEKIDTENKQEADKNPEEEIKEPTPEEKINELEDVIGSYKTKIKESNQNAVVPSNKALVIKKSS